MGSGCLCIPQRVRTLRVLTVMDHIPNTNDRRLDFDIPYYASKVSFDGKEWATYPERAGYPWLSGHLTVQEMNDHYQQCSTEELKAFAQSWMFFAVLKQFLGCHYNEAEFLRWGEQSDSFVIDTSVAQGWQLVKDSQRPILERPGKPAIHIVPASVTRFLLMVNAKASLWDRFAAGKDESWARLALSFRLLVEMLSFLPRHLARGKNAHCSLDLSAQPGPALDLIRRSLMKGSKAWCFHQIEALCSRLSYSALIYLTGLDRMERHGIDHLRCTERPNCIAYNTEIGVKIETAHEEEDCVCKHVQAPRDERVRILERGGIPVLHCVRDKEGKFDLHFVPASPDLKYCAISHLWADGLGNVFENSLPYCQLSRLVKAAHATNRSYLGPEISYRYSEAYIWIDVYCVPAQVPRAQVELEADFRSDFERRQDVELKKKAIARMDATYAWADYVLVLDRELMEMVTVDRHPRGTTIRHGTGPQVAGTRTIACMAVSAWNTRCWTYQEHAFARNTVLQGIGCQSQFDNRLGFSACHTTLQHDFLRIAGRQSVMGGGIKEFVARPKKSNARTKQIVSSSPFCSAWNLFYGRSTTQWKDMIVVLANMLDLSAAAVLQLDPHMQMKAILATHEHLPLSLLFVEMERFGQGDQHQDAASLEDRWIPTMPQSIFLKPSRTGDSMIVAPNGLLLQSAKLRTQAVWTLRVPIVHGRLVDTFQVHEQEYLEGYWIAVDQDQLRHCLKRLPFTPREAVILLDRSEPLLRVDDTAVCHGACLLPTGYEQAGKPLANAQTVVYVGPITWGRKLDIINGQAEMAYHVSTSGTPNLIISSDIASWPQLPPSRARKLQSVKGMRWVIILVHVLVIAVIFALSQSDLNADGKLFAITTPYQAPVPDYCDGEVCVVESGRTETVGSYSFKVLPKGAAFIAGLVSMSLFFRITYVIRYAMLLQLMYAVHSEIDGRLSWWRQLDAIFPLMVLREIRWWRWPEHLVLRMVVACIAWPVFTGEKVKGLMSRKHSTAGAEDVELQKMLI